MSLVIMASTRWPSTSSSPASCAAPSRPCSSPASAANTSVASKGLVLRAMAQASCMTAAVPEASSLAPGASPCSSMTSALRLS
jgi:hypothetical protein